MDKIASSWIEEATMVGWAFNTGKSRTFGFAYVGYPPWRQTVLERVGPVVLAEFLISLSIHVYLI